MRLITQWRVMSLLLYMSNTMSASELLVMTQLERPLTQELKRHKTRWPRNNKSKLLIHLSLYSVIIPQFTSEVGVTKITCFIMSC